MRTYIIALVALAGFVLLGSNARAVLDRPSEDQIDLILDTSQLICGDITLKGESTELKVKAEIEESPPLNKLMDSESKPVANYEISKFVGVSANQLLEIEKDTLECRLKIARAIIDKILPTNLAKSGAIPISLAEDPGAFASRLLKQMCFFSLGFSKTEMKGACRAKQCSIDYQNDVSGSSDIFYLSPKMSSSQFGKISGRPATGIKENTHNWPNSLSGWTFSVKSRLSTSNMLAEKSKMLSRCVSEVGTLFFDRLQLFDVGGIVPRLSPNIRNNYSISDTILDDIDLSYLQISLPKTITDGSAFVLELRLIPSLVLQTTSDPIEANKIDDEQRLNFEKLIG